MKYISVVIVSYHTGPILFESISSVLKQKIISQVIVVDNGNPASVVIALSSKFARDERFQLITGQGNIGFSRACNLAAKRATGDFILLLNPDCIVHEDGINHLVHIAESYKGKWLLTPHLINPDGTDQQGGRREILTPWIAFVEGIKLYRFLPNHPYFKRFNNHNMPLPTKVTQVSVTTGAFMLLKTSVYRELGGMDEGYFLHVEDIDFCLRFRNAGGNIYFCPNVTFVHVLGTSKVCRLFIEWHKMNGLKRYFRLHFLNIYPRGFISLVNWLIAIRFGLITIKEFLFGIFRFRLHRKKEVILIENKESISFTSDEKLG